MAASKIILLIFPLKEGFANRSVFVKFGKENLDI